MSKHEGMIRGYHRSHLAWYAKANNITEPEILFGLFDPEEGGTTGGMVMEWVNIGGESVANLNVFEDAWSTLSLFTDLIQRMGEVDNQLIQEPEFCKMLDECGFIDMTEYTNPRETQTSNEEETVTLSIPKKHAERLGLMNFVQ